ncbi:MAG: L,D-transpeptidase family protein [Lachnospiraceae bacterium]|nr:L,D-transpeptidase family protein [Lachnospiraceae bacterium]
MAKKRRKKKRMNIGGQVAIIFFVAVFAGGALYYAHEYQKWLGKFLPNTTVNGIDYSGMTAEEAEARFAQTYKGLHLTIEEMGGAEETINFEDIDYRYTTADTWDQLIKGQNYALWFMSCSRPTALSTKEGFTFDDEKLVKIVKDLKVVTDPDIVDPKDAKIMKGSDGYYIEEAVDGNRVKEDRLIEEVRNAVNEGRQKINLEELKLYKKASVYEDDEDLLERFAVIDKAQNTEIKMSMEGNTYVVLDKSTFLPWMSYESGKVVFDGDEIYAYTADLAKKYNTIGTKREFKTTKGDVLTVGGTDYDNYGYQMNVSESAALITKALESSTSQLIALAWDHYALARDEGGKSDFGDTYIEVSLDQQHMWYYVDGELQLDTDIVSGTATPKRATPTMVVQVLDKKKDHTMKGSYGESHADYALVIQESGILIHDSDWRDEYGDDIWLYDGSHGCINTPIRAMRELYDMAEISTPVIIYDRENRVKSFENETYTGHRTWEDDEEEDDENTSREEEDGSYDEDEEWEAYDEDE